MQKKKKNSVEYQLLCLAYIYTFVDLKNEIKLHSLLHEITQKVH